MYLKCSLIIPSCNAGNRFEDVLKKIQQQTLQPDEIIIADSESDDKTPEIAQKYGAQVITVPRKKFDHGGTRALAARKAAGDIIIFMTQDAIPADNFSFEHLCSVFSDERIHAAYGRQLPSEGATIAAAHLREFNYPAISHIRSYEDRVQFGIKTAFLSNSFSAYRAAGLEQAGYFKEHLIFGEDAFTAAAILRAGAKIAYCADAVVFHSHNYSFAEEFRRAFDTGVFHTNTGLAAEFGAAESEGKRYVVSLFKKLLKKADVPGIFDAVLRISCKVIGYKVGCMYKKLPCRVCRVCSLNRNYWKIKKSP